MTPAVVNGQRDVVKNERRQSYENRPYGMASLELDTALAQALAILLVAGLLVGLPTTVETLTRGRSLGKRVMGLRVVRDDAGVERDREILYAMAGASAAYGYGGNGITFSYLASRMIGRLIDGQRLALFDHFALDRNPV